MRVSGRNGSKPTLAEVLANVRSRSGPLRAATTDKGAQQPSLLRPLWVESRHYLELGPISRVPLLWCNSGRHHHARTISLLVIGGCEGHVGMIAGNALVSVSG